MEEDIKLENAEIEKIEDKVEEKAEAPQEELKFDYNDPVYKKNKKRASLIAVAIVVGLILMFGIVLWVWFFIVNYPIITITHKNIDDLKIEYTLDESGEFLKDINYEAYLDYSPSIFDGLFSKKIYLSEKGVSSENTAAQNTAIIQGLIDAIDSSTVIYVDGNYKIVSLELKSKTTIIIEENCSLIGPTYDDGQSISSVLWAKDAKNISIYGPGTVVGSGTSYTNEAENPTVFEPLEQFNVRDRVLEARDRIRPAKDKNAVRPHIIYLDNCSDVKIQNVRLYDSAFWTLKVIDSNNINIKDVVIDNNVHVANADGIDIVSSQKVKVSHCFIATADDGICIKAFGNENVDDVDIDRCSVMSMANNVKIGTETSKDVERIDITNCYFFMPTNVVGGYAGVAVESADGSNVRKVYVDNIYMKGISAPALIWLGDRLDRKNGSDGKTVGSIEGVTISNITAIDAELASAVTGCVRGSKTYYVKKVEIANFNITYRNTGEKLDVGKPDHEDSMSGYPEITRILHTYFVSHESSVYKDMPVYGLFARHVDGLKVYNLNVQSRSCNTLPRDNITQAKDRYDVLNVSVN